MSRLRCLVLDNYDNSLHFQRVMQAAGKPSQSSKAALELNAAHAIVKKLESTQDEQHFAERAMLL